MEQQAFEFSAAQNETIRVLSGRMKFVGIFFIVIGALLGIGGLFALFVSPIVGLVYLLLTAAEILIGVWTMNASSSFKMIVETTGSDIAHLDKALESLRKLYNLQFWLLIVSIGLFVLIFIIGIIGGMEMMGTMETM